MNHSDRDQYYRRATTWALDEQESVSASLRRTRLLAIGITLIAVLEAFALILLTPLKTVTMVPVLVDRQTGFVERLNPDGSQELRANDALIQSLLAQYVTAREGYDVSTVAAEYRKVALWSAGAARQDYLALMPASNPGSPLRRYPRTALVDAVVKSVSPLGNHTALVRFETRRRDQGVQSAGPSEWAAVVAYVFSNKDLSAADRWLNPLGFEVVSYRRDAEALPAPEPQEAQPAVAEVGPVTTPGSVSPAPSAVPWTPPTSVVAPPSQVPSRPQTPSIVSRR
jgi:type IV secretion system protein VirB8